MPTKHEARTPWNKGRKETRPEVLLRQSESHIGQIGSRLGVTVSASTKRKISLANKGRKQSVETIAKIVAKTRGQKRTSEVRARLSEIAKKNGVGKWSKGRTLSEETKIKIGKASRGRSHSYMQGGNNWNWKGGIAPEHNKIRGSIESKLWIQSVFSRDGHTCQKTGVRGGNLTAHHILNFAQYPELRFAIDNGITLSVESHKEFHRKYGNKNNTREQLEEYLGRPL